MPRTLRLPGETDDDSRDRADRVGRIAFELVEACLAIECVQIFVADSDLPFFSLQGRSLTTRSCGLSTSRQSPSAESVRLLQRPDLNIGATVADESTDELIALFKGAWHRVPTLFTRNRVR